MNTKALILLFLANAISGIAQGISMIAIPWYFAQKEQLGYFVIVYLVTNIIALFWVPLSGTLVDKYDRKHLFMAVTLVGGFLISILAALGIYRGGLSEVFVASAFVFTFMNYNIHYPNLYAFMQEITVKERYSTMTSLMEIIGQCTTVTAGALATLLLEGTKNGNLKLFNFEIPIGWNIEPWAIHEIFVIDAVTYFTAFCIIATIKYQPLTVRKPELGSIVERLKLGWRYLMSDKPVLWFGILSYMVFVAMLMEAFYLGVSYVNNHLEGSGDIYANSKMAYACGAICVGITLRQLFKKVSLPALTVVLTFVTALVFFTQFASKSIPLFFLMLFVLGISNAGTRIARITYLFRNVPNQFFGRSGSIFFLVNILFRIGLLAVFSLAFFQQGNNVIYAYLMIAILLLAATGMLMYHYRSFDLSKQA